MLPLMRRRGSGYLLMAGWRGALLFAVVSLGAPGTRAASTPAELPGLRWRAELGSDDTDHFATAAAALKDEVMLIAGISSPAGSRGRSGRFWLWRVDGDGKKIADAVIRGPLENKQLNGVYPYVKAMAPHADGSVTLVAEFEEGFSSIVRVDAAGAVTFARPLAEPGVRTIVHKMLAVDGEALLLLGSRDGDAFAGLVNPQGVSEWQRRHDRGATDLFLDAAPAGDDFVFLGNSGSYDAFATGPSKLWIGRLDRKGEVLSEQTFPGRYGRLISVPSGFVLVYDRSDSVRQDIWVMGLNAELEQTWQTSLVAAERGIEQFKILPLSPDAYAVAGSKDLSLWVAAIDGHGKPMWIYSGGQPGASLWKADQLFKLAGDVVLLSPVNHVNATGQLARKVGLARFSAKQ